MTQVPNEHEIRTRYKPTQHKMEVRTAVISELVAMSVVWRDRCATCVCERERSTTDGHTQGWRTEPPGATCLPSWATRGGVTRRVGRTRAERRRG